MDEQLLDVAVQVTAFWANVQRGSPNECWEWTDYKEKEYGRYFFLGRMRFAHDLALMFATGEVRGERLDTCHRCNNPPCCNPNHLRYDTRKSNVADMYAAGRQNLKRKLTDDQIVVIRERAAAGAPGLSLARDYGMSPSYITQVIRGQQRASAGGPIRTTTTPPRNKR